MNYLYNAAGNSVIFLKNNVSTILPSAPSRTAISAIGQRALDYLPSKAQIANTAYGALEIGYSGIVGVKKIAVDYYYQPTSVKPNISFDERKEHSGFSVRKWPKDLTVIGMNEEGKKYVDERVRIRNISELQKGKKSWKQFGVALGMSGGQLTEIQVNVPRVSCINNQFFLHVTASIRGEARKVAYNLTTGEFWLKSKLLGPHEKQIIDALNNHRTSERKDGFIFTEKRTSKKTSVEKEFQFVPLRDGNLNILFNTTPFQNFQVRLKIITDLFLEIGVMTNLRFSQEGTEIYEGYLGNICFENVKVYLQHKTWRAEFSQFRSASDVTQMPKTRIGWESPEDIVFKLAKDDNDFNQDLGFINNVSKYNSRYGNKRDMWSFGLLCLAVLAGKKETLRLDGKDYHMAPLPSIKNFYENLHNKRVKDAFVMLDQDEIYSEIEALEKDICSQYPESENAVRTFISLIKHFVVIYPDQRGNLYFQKHKYLNFNDLLNPNHPNRSHRTQRHRYLTYK